MLCIWLPKAMSTDPSRAPIAFIQTNIVGTFTLLEAAREHWSGLNDEEKQIFRFLARIDG